MHDLLLKNLKSGGYDGLGGSSLAEKLQSDARSVVDDKHLRIRFTGAKVNSTKKRTVPQYKHSIGVQNILENNIGYLEITGFQQPDNKLKASLAKKMEVLKDVDALIIDMRNNGGGSPAGVQLICSYFFTKEPIHLNTLYFRNRDFRKDFFTLEELKGPRLAAIPLYLLTSDYTFSGGEEFVYNLKNLKRATVIGETTGGGAHPVGSFTISADIRAIIPVGRAISPITGTNWEAVGVTPHIDIDESEALEKALSVIR